MIPDITTPIYRRVQSPISPLVGPLNLYSLYCDVVPTTISKVDDKRKKTKGVGYYLIEIVLSNLLVLFLLPFLMYKDLRRWFRE